MGYVLFLAICLPITNCYGQSWKIIEGGRYSSNKISKTSSKNNSEMGGRSSFAAAASDKFMFVHGGWGLNEKGGCSVLNDVWEYEIKTKKWKCLIKNSLDSSTNSRSNHIVVLHHNKLFFFFGIDYDKQNKKITRSDVVSYNIETGKYNFLKFDMGKLPLSRHSAITWSDNSKLYVLGGVHIDSLGRNVVLNDFWSFNLNDNAWSKLSEADVDYCVPYLNEQQENISDSREYAQPNFVRGGVAWVHNSNLYYYVSLVTSGFINNSQIWKYNTLSNKWKLVKVSRGRLSEYGEIVMPGFRKSSVVWVDHNNIYLYGGFSYNSSRLYGIANDTWKLNMEDFSWIRISPIEECEIYASVVYDAEEQTYNNPGARIETTGLTVSNGNFTEHYLLGGLLAHNGKVVYRNDIWKLEDNLEEKEKKRIKQYKGNRSSTGTLQNTDCPLKILSNISLNELRIVASEKLSNVSINIYSLSGELVAEFPQAYIGQGQTVVLDIAKLLDGQYIVQYIVGNSKKCSDRIVINHLAH